MIELLNLSITGTHAEGAALCTLPGTTGSRTLYGTIVLVVPGTRSVLGVAGTYSGSSLQYLTLHTAHCTLHTAHCTLHTAHCTLHTAHCTLHTTHYTLHTTHCTLHTAHCTLCIHSCTTVHCTVTVTRYKYATGTCMCAFLCHFYI